MPLEAEPLQTAGPELLEERAAGRFVLEGPGLGLRRRQAARPARAAGSSRSTPAGDDDLARAAGRDSSSASARARGAEYSAVVNSPVERSSSATPSAGVGRRPGRGNAQQERRFTRVEVLRVGEACRATPLVTISRRTSPLAFAGSSTWSQIATRKPLLDQPREIRIDRVMGHAAHRDRRTLAVLGSRGEGQFEGPRGHQRVLVEHLVEVAHPEEQDGVASTAASPPGTAAWRA